MYNLSKVSETTLYTRSQLKENARTDYDAIIANWFYITQSLRSSISLWLDSFADEDDVSEEEIEQVKTSRREIAEGKARRFQNAEEYLKTLDEESE